MFLYMGMFLSKKAKSEYKKYQVKTISPCQIIFLELNDNHKYT